MPEHDRLSQARAAQRTHEKRRLWSSRVQRGTRVLFADGGRYFVNFFAHAKVALWRSADPRFVLGAMLPDLTGMLGLRIRTVDHPELAAGVAFHHATDAAFHASRIFVAQCAEGLAALSAAGVSRGTARAVAHVGTELLLDGVLSRDIPALAAYRGALDAATRERFVDHLDFEKLESSAQLHDGLARLAKAPVPEGYRELGFVVARLRGTLARRPRLAMHDRDLESVEAFVAASQLRIIELWPALLEEVRSGLESASAALPV